MQCHESIDPKPIPNATVCPAIAPAAAKVAGDADDAERCCQAIDGLAAVAEAVINASIVANAAAVAECDSNIAAADGNGWVSSPGSAKQ